MAQARPQPVTIDTHAIANLIDYCHSHGISKLVLVADQNTYGVLGQAVETSLNKAGL